MTVYLLNSLYQYRVPFTVCGVKGPSCHLIHLYIYLNDLFSHKICCSINVQHNVFIVSAIIHFRRSE